MCMFVFITTDKISNYYQQLTNNFTNVLVLTEVMTLFFKIAYRHLASYLPTLLENILKLKTKTKQVYSQKQFLNTKPVFCYI